MSGKIKILVGDDHPMILEGFYQILKSSEEIEIVDVCNDGETLVTKYEESLPDVTVIDIKMPVMNGYEAAEAILRHNPNAKMLFYSSTESKVAIYKTYAIGARGFISKLNLVSKLVEAIKTVNEPKLYFDDFFSEAEYQKMKMEIVITPKRIELSDREEEILTMIAKGLSSKNIGEILRISERTVETHRRNIRKKMNLLDNSALLQFSLLKYPQLTDD